MQKINHQHDKARTMSLRDMQIGANSTAVVVPIVIIAVLVVVIVLAVGPGGLIPDFFQFLTLSKNKKPPLFHECLLSFTVNNIKLLRYVHHSQYTSISW